MVKAYIMYCLDDEHDVVMEGEDDDIDLEELDENERAEFNVRISFCLD